MTGKPLTETRTGLLDNKGFVLWKYLHKISIGFYVTVQDLNKYKINEKSNPILNKRLRIQELTEHLQIFLIV